MLIFLSHFYIVTHCGHTFIQNFVFQLIFNLFYVPLHEIWFRNKKTL
jgi:hypothetical protein